MTEAADRYAKQNRSPNPEGRFTLFPGKDDATTFTLTRGCRDAIADLARQATTVTGKAISRSDIVEACVTRCGDIVDWIRREVQRRDEEAASRTTTAGTAGAPDLGGTPREGVVPPGLPAGS